MERCMSGLLSEIIPQSNRYLECKRVSQEEKELVLMCIETMQRERFFNRNYIISAFETSGFTYTCYHDIILLDYIFQIYGGNNGYRCMS